LIVLLAVAPAPGRAGTTERVVTDRFTGLAISGFDPVAYFTDARPRPGDAAYELSDEGVVWRFHNEGNRASFAANPEIYGPQFGGYDPVDVARGVAYAGNPQLWLVVDQRLYLFGREESRSAFAAAPAAVLAEARKRWTMLRSELSR
jgi:YHS domain-containing protein